MYRQPVINVDYTHVGRRASGIERVTSEQFNGTVLSPLEVKKFTASGSRPKMMFAQMVGLPLRAIANRCEVFVFPGFPPSPYFALQPHRSVLYVHDLFLLTRRDDLNRAARYYMAPLFSIALRRFRYFLTNSAETARQLAAFCNPNATIITYRPFIRNVFDLAVGDRASRAQEPEPLKIVSVGTIEPRKNIMAAVQIRSALSAQLTRDVELHIIGRPAWGVDISALASQPNVILHGYLDDAKAKSVIEAADLLLCTSHDEGLCLPLLEAQYSGIPVAAPNEAVFREVLGTSGTLLGSRSPESAAQQIAATLTDPAWRSRQAAAAAANISRWNAIAENDRCTVISFLIELAERLSPDPPPSKYSSITATPLSASTRPDAPPNSQVRNPLVHVDGQPINLTSLADAVEAVTERLKHPRSFLVCTLNLDHLVKLRQLSSFRQAYARAELVTADGFPVVVLSRIRGRELQRVPGSDLIVPLCDAAARLDFGIFLLGSSFSVLCSSARRLKTLYPGLTIAGIYAPPPGFQVRSAAADEAISLLRESGARLCFLALGAPLQEVFAVRALDETEAIGFIGIGAGLDFLAGKVVRAPQLVQRLNLEWAWRLMSDPRRLWLRYVKCGLLFARLLIGEFHERRARYSPGE